MYYELSILLSVLHQCTYHLRQHSFLYSFGLNVFPPPLLLLLLLLLPCAVSSSVICGFRGSGCHGMALEVGESVHILEKSEGTSLYHRHSH